MEQASKDEPNPRADLEHPGPEAPANKGTASSSSSSSQSQSQSDGAKENTETSHGGSPAIHRPKSEAGPEDPDVKKHNEEMEQRSDRSVNQLGEKDNKVNKKFWQGK